MKKIVISKFDLEDLLTSNSTLSGFFRIDIGYVLLNLFIPSVRNLVQKWYQREVLSLDNLLIEVEE